MHKRLRILLCAAVVVLSSILALIPKDAYAATPPYSVTCRTGVGGNQVTVTISATDTTGEQVFNASRTGNLMNPCGNFGLTQQPVPNANTYTGSFSQSQFDTFRQAVQNASISITYDVANDNPPPTTDTYHLTCSVTATSASASINLTVTDSNGRRVSLPTISQENIVQNNLNCHNLAAAIGVSASSNNRIDADITGSQLTQLQNYITEQLPDPNDPTDSELGDSEAPAPECELGAMGWAICPLMNAMDSMLGGAYKFIEENFLQIQVDFYNTSSGTYTAWGTFRNIANILFVIFFLVVIFSQVTSVGISNYGIKKMLPEIILAAILINLSFFIAQAMIDVSNIVGFQIKNLLEAIAGTLPGGLGEMTPGQGFLAGLSSILIGTGVAVGALAIGAVTMGGFGALFAAVLLFLLSALIGVLVLFLLLVVRQVGVIILVVLAPLAFAARILPNTQSLFRTWWKMFVSLLVVYPACGLVIGAGKLAGKIIVTAAGNVPETEMVGIIGSILGPNVGMFAAVAARTMYLVVAMIAMIAPYFAVITIIKGSLNGLGKLGGAITGKLDSAGKWGQNNINKAPGLRNLQNYADNSRALRANAIKSKLDSANAAANAKKMANGEGGALRKGIAGTKLGKKLGISDKNIYGQMQDAEFQAAQAKDDAGMASLGQYQGERTSREGKRLGKISDANAARLGVNPDGTPNGTKTFAAGSFEEHQQQAARTAVLQQEAKQSKQIDEQYDAMLSPGDVMKDVYDSSGALKTSGNAAADNLRRERAIASLVKKGKIDDATQLVKDYSSSASYAGNKHAQQRLSSFLTSGDVKKSAANLYAYGKQVGTDLSTGTAAGNYASMDGAGGAIEKIMQEKISASDVASQDKDADWTKFSSKQMASALASGASQDKVTVMNNALVSNPTMAADVGKRLTAEQYGKLDDSTVLEIANQALVAAGYGGASFTDTSTLQGYVSANPAARTAMQGAFQGAFDQADPTKVAGTRAADHWSSDRRSILGL